MGLHRTDTALVTYWMFYAADRGIDAPQLHGYLKEKGLTTDKMMRIINAFYKYWQETKGASPIPEAVFKERKKIILQRSRGE